jgi:hypothetical protein
VSAERAKAESRLRGLPSQRRPLLLAALAAVLLSVLLGAYLGYRQAPAPSAVGGALSGEPLKLRLERNLAEKTPR